VKLLDPSTWGQSAWSDQPSDLMRLRRDVPRRTYADNNPYGWTGTGGGQTSQSGVYTDPYTGQAGNGQGASGSNGIGSLGGATSSGYDPTQGQPPPSPATVINDPGSTQGDVAPFEQSSPVAANPYAFQYGNTVQDPEAAGWVSQYNSMANGGANITAAQMQNPNATTNLNRSQGVINSEQGTAGALGGLGSFETSVANGTGPNLAQAQMNASTDQNIAAQQAAAHSATGSLASSAANRNASTQGVAMGQGAAEQSAINTINQQTAAAGAAGSLYGAQGNVYGQEGTQAGAMTNVDETTSQANLAAAQSAALANQQAGYNYAGLTQSVLGSSLSGQEAGQNNKLGMGAQGIQQQQANNAQNNAMISAGTSSAGALIGLLAADADLQEPGGTAAWTLREESGGPGHDPFILALDRQKGRALKLATEPLSRSEHEQAFREPHGAGPLGEDDPRRQRTVANDMQMFQPQGQQGRPMFGAQPQAGQLAGAPGYGPTTQAQMAMRPADPSMAARPAMQPAPQQMRPMMQQAPMQMAQGRPMPMQQFAQRSPMQAQMAARPMAQGQPMPMQQRAPQQAMPMQRGFAGAQPAFADMDLAHGMHGHFADAPIGPSNFNDPASLARLAQAQTQSDDPLAASYSNFNGGQPASAQAVADATAGWKPFASGKAAKAAERATEIADDPLVTVPKSAPQPNRMAGMSPDQAARIAHDRDPDSPLVGGADHVDPKDLVKQQPIAGAASAAAAPGAGTVPGMGGVPGKAGWVDNAPPGTIGAVQAAEDAERAADEDAATASQHANEDATVGHLQRADVLKTGADEQAAATAAHDKFLTEQEARRDALSNDAKKAGEAYGWKPSTGTRIAYGIAAALGAFGASLGHGQNAALEIINSSINRDLDAQKQAIESKKGKVADMDTALAQAYRRFGNMDQAMAAARSVKLQQVDEQIAAHGEASQGEAQKAQADAARAQVARQQAFEDSKLYAHVTTGGAGGPIAQKYQAYVTGELSKPGGKAMSYPEFVRALSGAGGESPATKPGAGKVNPKAAALDASLATPTHGLDFWDRNAPDFLRSSASLANERALAAQARAATAAVGRAPPLTMSASDVNKQVIGRPDDASVAAFRHRAAATAATMRNAATEGQPADLAEP
jgi:hypothetical protein